MPVESKRTTFVFGDEFWDFYNAQSLSVQDKIDWVIGLVRTLTIVPKKYLKYIKGTDGLFEIRVQTGNNIFRVFCFFDRDKLIILLNGFQKKTDKIPKGQIERAARLKQMYYDKQTKT